jgi:hypothetical protein
MFNPINKEIQNQRDRNTKQHDSIRERQIAEEKILLQIKQNEIALMSIDEMKKTNDIAKKANLISWIALAVSILAIAAAVIF